MPPKIRTPKSEIRNHPGRPPTVPGGLTPTTIRLPNPTLQWLRSLPYPTIAHAIRDIIDHHQLKADK